MFKGNKIIILYAFLSVALLGGVFFLGVYVGNANRPSVTIVTDVFNKEGGKQADFESFWKVWTLINEKYAGDQKTADERVWGATKGLVASLGDPYTVFFDPKESKSFEESITGEFTGIGVEIGVKDKLLTVIAPLKNTPAYRAGLKPGDKILAIDKVIAADITIDEAIEHIRGEKGTEVVLTIARVGESGTIEIPIVRDTINIPTLETEQRADGIFVIRLFNFSAQSPTLFRNALREFVSTDSNKLLLDLRGNPGGYLEAAIDMASWFLPDDKVVVLEESGQEKKEEAFMSKGYNIFPSSLKFVILVDGGSASASEILTGALMEHGVAVVVGTQTYGKGSVQELVQITPDTSFKVTVAKWFTPNGISISEKGLTPNYVVPLSKEEGVDPQLDKALSLLNS